MAIYFRTNITPFDLILSLLPPEFTMDHPVPRKVAESQDNIEDDARRFYLALEETTASFRHAPEWFQCDFDFLLRKTSVQTLGEADFPDMNHPAKKKGKLSHNVARPYKILNITEHTALIQWSDVMERVLPDHIGRALSSARPV